MFEETEYKYLMSKEQFNSILERLKSKFEIRDNNIQINYYYDTQDNLLDTRNITVRVRQVGEKLKWQIKCHRDEQNALLCSDEYEGTLEDLPLLFRIGDTNGDLELKGCLVTDRKELHFGEGSKICFDTSMYLGMIDYEIEIEYIHCDKRLADTIAAELATSLDIIMPKSKRFFERWEVINRGKSAVTLC